IQHSQVALYETKSPIGTTSPSCIRGKTPYPLFMASQDTTFPSCILGNKFSWLHRGTTFPYCILGNRASIFFLWLHRGTTFPGCILGNKNPYPLFMASQ
ncbi:hypothetical protein HAX54_000256, partial [Datura stramonium]|nr:hypothetical protein [Datura stramonium]